MSSAINIATRALTTNLAALQVVGHNISNVNTEGYSRQNVLLQSAGHQAFGNGFFGKGVEIATVTRNHSTYLTREASLAKSAASADGVRLSKLKQLEDLFPTGSTGLGASMNSMLNAWSDVASAPGNLTARAVVIARGDEFAARLSNTARQLDQHKLGTELQVQGTVETVNRLAQDLASLNQRISETRGSAHTPNDMLDQRDQLLSQLNQYVQTATVPAEDGTVSVFVGGSQPLVLGQNANKLDFPKGSNPRVLAFVQGGVRTPLDDKALGGGELAGLMTFLRQDLPDMQSQLDRLGFGLAAKVNEQHRLGVDLNDGSGRDFFARPTVAGVPASGNSTAKASVSLSGQPRLPVPEYELLVTSGGVDVTRDGTTTSLTGTGPFVLDGLTFTVDSLAAGDRFAFRPDSGAAINLTMSLTAANQLAAASPVRVRAGDGNSSGLSMERLSAISPVGSPVPSVTLTFLPGGGFSATGLGPGSPPPDNPSPPAAVASYNFVPGKPIEFNGWSLTLRGSPGPGDAFTVDAAPAGSTRQNTGNAGAMLVLREQPTFDGVPLADGYTSLFSSLGTAVQSAKFSADFTAQIATSSEKARAGVSGVNLDEEAARLLQYQQSYQAAAKFLQIAQSTFDTLLQTVGR